MLIRMAVVLYFPSFFVGVGLSKVLGSDMLRGVPLAVAGVGLLYALGRAILRPGVRSLGPSRPVRLILLYTVVYGILYFPRAYPGLNSLGLVPSLTIHVLFWHAAYWSPLYRRYRDRFFGDLFTGLFAGFLVGLVGALDGAGWRLRPGALHNLSEVAPFVRSDLDIPLLAAVLAVAATAAIAHGPRSAPLGAVERVLWRSRHVAGAFVLPAALFALYLYGRRVPIAATLAGMGLVLLPARFVQLAVAALLAAPLAPLLWSRLVPVLIAITQNPVANAILARNDLREYVTASNRMATWLDSLDFLSVPTPQHLYGFGGAPEHLLPVDLPWDHVHNGPLQAIFDAGIPFLLLATFLLIQAVSRLGAMSLDPEQSGTARVLLAMMVIWLVESAVEPALRGYSIVHLLFLLTLTTAAGLYYETKTADANLRSTYRDAASLRASSADLAPAEGIT